MSLRVFLDANVIASKTLRDWLFKLSLFDPRVLSLCSSDLVLEEARRTFARRNPPADRTIVDSLFERIRAMFDHVVIWTGSPSEIDGINIDDVHVHHERQHHNRILSRRHHDVLAPRMPEFLSEVSSGSIAASKHFCSYE
jgi:hypothetical protein